MVWRVPTDTMVCAFSGTGVVVILAGVLGIIAYFIFLCCRAGCACCRKDAKCGPHLSRAILIVLSLAMMLTTLCSYVGFVTFIDGSSGMATSLGDLIDSINLLDGYAADLSANGEVFQEQSESSGCPDAVDFKSAADRFYLHSTIYSEALPAISLFDGLITMFEEQFPNYVKYALGFAAALSCVVFLFSFLGVACKSSLILNLSSLVSIFLYLLLVALAAVEMTLSVLFADFCVYGPTTAVNDMSGAFGETPKKVIDYYVSCEGTNPLDIQLNKTINTLAVISNFTAHDGGCKAAPIAAIGTEITSAAATQASMATTQACSAIYDVYFEMVDTHLCSKTVSGLWELWAVHITAACLLYVCMYFTSHVKQKCKMLVLMDEEGAVKAIPLGPPLAPHTV